MQLNVFVPPPGHPLRRYVAAMFRVRARGAYAQELILPRATVELLFSLGDPLRAGDAIDMRTSRVGGVCTAPLTVRPVGAVDLVGVSVRVETGAALLPVPLGELTDASIEGDAVHPELAAVRQRLGEAAAFEAQCAVLGRWLLARLRPDRWTEGVSWACRELRRADGDATRVARGLGVTPRHLRRLLAERVGLGPSAYVRVRRFSEAVALMHRARTLTEVAHAAGYFDQPHFCRDFKTFAGMTPQEYLRARGPVPGNVFTP
jgi:AraC-like DNA-binding protein